MTDTEMFLQAVQFLEDHQKQRVSIAVPLSFRGNENTVFGSPRNSGPFLPGDVASSGCETMFRCAQRTRREENCPTRTNTFRCFIYRVDTSSATSRIIRRGFESAKLTVDLKRRRKRKSWKERASGAFHLFRARSCHEATRETNADNRVGGMAARQHFYYTPGVSFRVQ